MTFCSRCRNPGHPRGLCTKPMPTDEVEGIAVALADMLDEANVPDGQLGEVLSETVRHYHRDRPAERCEDAEAADAQAEVLLGAVRS